MKINAKKKWVFFLLMAILIVYFLIINFRPKDFAIYQVGTQNCIMKSSTSKGAREFLFQYNYEDASLYSFQPCVCNKDESLCTTKIRCYNLRNDCHTEWTIRGFFSGWENEMVSVVRDNLYYVDPELGKIKSDNLQMVCLQDDNLVNSASRAIKGVCSQNESCMGMLRIGDSRLLLKLLNLESYEPSIVLFDCDEQKILKKVGLFKSDSGEFFDSSAGKYFWKLSSRRVMISVSVDRSQFAVRTEDGNVCFYDSNFQLKKVLAIKNLLGTDTQDTDWEWMYMTTSFSYLDDGSVMLWSEYGGWWWIYDLLGDKIIHQGRIKLLYLDEDTPSGTQKQEYLTCVLNSNQFVVKGFKEGLFSKEGYIVTVDENGQECRQKVPWGVWPKKRLTDEYYYAEGL